MRFSRARRLGLLALALAGLSAAELQGAEPVKAAAPAQLQNQEKEACMANLKKIYAAIQAYQDDHKDLPYWLSDLVPQYLPDATVLICPLCRRTGKTEAPPLADPKLACSYLFEFCPVPLGAAAPNVPNRTRREWKRRQMGLVGSAVPIVRCRHHNPALNVAFDGRIYESPGMWEQALTNRVNITNLTAVMIFAGENDAPASKPSRFAARDAKARPGMLDLTRHYNASFKEPWIGITNHHLSLAPQGIQKLAGVEFDVRGIVQLGGKSVSDKKYPAQAKGIPVKQKCRVLHFLQAAHGVTAADDGVQIGSYVIHYAGNRARIEVPIIAGKDLQDWQTIAPDEALPAGLAIAWSSDKASAQGGSPVARLFVSTWTNFAPDLEIESIDFVSNLAGAAPFLVAITAE